MSFHCGSDALRNSRVCVKTRLKWPLWICHSPFGVEWDYLLFISEISFLLIQIYCNLMSVISYFCWWKSVGVQFSLTKLSQVDFIFSRHEDPNKAGVLEAMQRGVTARVFLLRSLESMMVDENCKSTNFSCSICKKSIFFAWVACMKTFRAQSVHPQSRRINTRLEPASSLWPKCLHDQLLWGPSGGTQTAAIGFINLVSENRAGTLYKDIQRTFFCFYQVLNYLKLSNYDSTRKNCSVADFVSTWRIGLPLRFKKSAISAIFAYSRLPHSIFLGATPIRPIRGLQQSAQHPADQAGPNVVAPYQGLDDTEDQHTNLRINGTCGTWWVWVKNF